MVSGGAPEGAKPGAVSSATKEKSCPVKEVYDFITIGFEVTQLKVIFTAN